jgi:hypothetical protein
LNITRTIPTGKHWHSAERYLAHELSAKRTRQDGLGRLYVKKPSRVDHDSKIRSRKQETDIGKHSFVNRAIQLRPRNQIAYLTDQAIFEQTARRTVLGRVNNWPNSPTTT